MNSQDFNFRIGEAENAVLAGNLREGKALLGKLADDFPSNPRILNNLGTVAHVEGDVGEAVKYFRAAHDFAPEDRTYLLNLGDVLQEMGKLEEVSEIYFKFLDGKPLDKDVLHALIQVDEKIYDALLLSCDSIEGSFRKRDFSISVLVSTYASEDFIRECLEDLESQSIADQLEIIIVDAHSPQNEKSIVQEFQKQYDNIRYLHTPNRIGIYPAWNMAIRAATGKYLLPFSTNDRLAPNACQVLLEAIEQIPEAGLVYGDSYLTDLPHQKFGQHLPSSSCDGMFCWPEYNYEFLLMSCGIGAHPLWRKAIHASVGYFDSRYKAVSDQDFWLRLGQQFPMYHICTFTGLVWLTKDSLSGGKVSAEEIYVIQTKYAKAYRETKVMSSATKLPHKSSQIELLLSERHCLSVMVSTDNADVNFWDRIQNLLEQSLFQNRKMEIIIADSSLQKSEQARLADLLDSHSNIVYFHTSKEYPFETWNRMVMASRGRYLAHIDSNSRLSAEAMERMAEELDARPVALVYADAFVTNNSKESFATHTAKIGWSFPDFNVRQALVDSPFGSLVMWRRALHAEIGLFNESLHVVGDYEFFLKSALAGGAYHIPLPLYLQFEPKHKIPYGQSNVAKMELDSFLPDVRISTPIDVAYPFLKSDFSPKGMGLAALDFGTLLLDQNGRVGYSEAEFFYRLSLSKLGEVPEVINNLAFVLGYQGKKEEAGRLLRDAMQKFPALKSYVNLDGPHPQAKRLFSLEYPALQKLPRIIFRVEQRIPIETYHARLLEKKSQENVLIV